jgi:hypothetical protein
MVRAKGNIFRSGPYHMHFSLYPQRQYNCPCFGFLIHTASGGWLCSTICTMLPVLTLWFTCTRHFLLVNCHAYGVLPAVTMYCYREIYRRGFILGIDRRIYRRTFLVSNDATRVQGLMLINPFTLMSGAVAAVLSDSHILEVFYVINVHTQ